MAAVLGIIHMYFRPGDGDGEWRLRLWGVELTDDEELDLIRAFRELDGVKNAEPGLTEMSIFVEETADWDTVRDRLRVTVSNRFEVMPISGIHVH